MLRGKNVVLGVTGSVAVYKAVELASKMVQAGAAVDVIMTEAAARFVTPLLFGSLTRRPVITEMFQTATDYRIAHVSLAEAADIVVVCPATANTIAKLANGLADDMLSCTVLAATAPVVVAPAMNVNMYQNAITQENIDRLKRRGVIFVGPAVGRLASGIEGAGRLVDIAEILGVIKQVIGRNGELAGKKVVVTAGGTREPVDPVRYLGNHSSGKMGYALAEAARDRGAEVVLISAPTSLPAPAGVEITQVQTALQMRDAVVKSVVGADILVMAAAVADYSPKNTAENKIKKGSESLVLDLIRTPDILSEMPDGLVKVGFAAESENLEENARKKLKDKRLDLIVANDITAKDSGFGVDTNEVVIIDRNGGTERMPLLQKSEVADKIFDRIADVIRKS